MKYKIGSAVLLLVCVILAISLVNKEMLLRQAVVGTYNKWISDISATHLLLQGTTNANQDSIAIQEAKEVLNNVSGRINNAIGYPTPARDTIGMLANLDFELINEFAALQTNAQVEENRAFLVAQLELVTKKLPQEVRSITQLNKLRDRINVVTEDLHENFIGYINES